MYEFKPIRILSYYIHWKLRMKLFSTSKVITSMHNCTRIIVSFRVKVLWASIIAIYMPYWYRVNIACWWNHALNNKQIIKQYFCWPNSCIAFYGRYLHLKKEKGLLLLYNNSSNMASDTYRMNLKKLVIDIHSNLIIV